MAVGKMYADMRAKLSAWVGYLTDGTGGPSENATRLLVTGERVNALAIRENTYLEALDAVETPATDTAIARHTLETEWHLSDEFLRREVQEIKHNSAVKVDADFDTLDINRDKTTRSPAVKPDTAPIGILVYRERLMAILSATRPVPGEENHASKPDGVDDVHYAMAFNAVGEAPPARVEFTEQPPSGTARVHLNFTTEQLNMQCHIILWYGNKAGYGPESAILSFNVPG